MTNNMGQTMSAGCDFLSQLEQREWWDEESWALGFSAQEHLSSRC
jgi:hypothetical protein